jgi:glycosyltransferase involved in cell wall biosynthesis
MTLHQFALLPGSVELSKVERSSPMLIGIDGIPLCEPKTGVGHYTFELSRALAELAPQDRINLISHAPFDDLIKKEIDRTDLPVNLSFVQAKPRSFDRYWWTIGLPRYIRRAQITLFHGTNYDVPLWSACPTVLSIHDLSLLLHAATHERRRVLRGRLRLPLMARAATMIVTHLESIRREIIEHLRVPPERIVAVPAAPRRIFYPVSFSETARTRKRLGVEEEFILFVGTLEPRKNLRTLVRAFVEIQRATEHRPQLVIVGKKGWLTNELFAGIEVSGIKDRVGLTGYLTDEELRALYSSCRVFVYPSLYEGFGLPPLEAMACGAPVVASRIASIAETTGTGARLVEPTDANALAQSIVALLEDESERRHLSAVGLKRAAEFSWARTAQATREVYLEALRRGRFA